MTCSEISGTHFRCGLARLGILFEVRPPRRADHLVSKHSVIGIHRGAAPMGELPGYRDNEYSRATKGAHRPKRPNWRGDLGHRSERGMGLNAHIEF